MYYSDQTLYHKKTHQLIALNPEGKATFNWELGSHKGLTKVVTEEGVITYVNISEYTNFEDWFGRPTGSIRGETPTNKYVNDLLKRYLVFGVVREANKVKALHEWKERLLKKLDECDEPYLWSWCCDGSKCFEFKKFFIKEMKMKPMYKYNRFSSEGEIEEGFHFKRKGRVWMVKDTDMFIITKC